MKKCFILLSVLGITCGLSSMDLDYSKEEKFDEAALSAWSDEKLAKVSSLNLIDNNLTRFPRVLERMTGLEVLDVSFNPIEDEEQEELPKIPSLKKIFCDETNLSRTGMLYLKLRWDKVVIGDHSKVINTHQPAGWEPQTR